MESDNTIWIVLGIVVAIVVPISVFAGNQITKTRRDKRTEINNKLRIHFEDIKREVIEHITQMTRNLTIRNGRLVYGAYSNILPTHRFEQSDYYSSFKAHFPKEAEQWEQVNKEALYYAEKYEPLLGINARFTELKKMQAHQRPDNWASEHEKYEQEFKNMSRAFSDEIKDLVDKCRTFSIQLSNMIENISKYGIGIEFKKLNNCPICKKF